MGEAGVRERVHDTAEDGGYAVSPDGAHDVVAANAFLDDFAGGEDVASGLDHGDNHDDDEGEDGDEVELRNAEVEGRGDAKRVGGGDLGKGGITQRESDGSAEHEADEDRERTQEAAEEALDKDDDGEGAEAVEEVAGGRHAFRVVDEVVGGDREQRCAHDEEHRAGDDRREEAQHLAKDRSGEEGEQTRDDDGAIDGGQGGGAAFPVRRAQANGDDGGDRRGGHALDDGQTHTHVLADARRLDKGRQTTGEQVSVDEVDGRRGVEIERARNEERNDDGAGVEREDVLEAERGELGRRRDGIDSVGGTGGHSVRRVWGRKRRRSHANKSSRCAVRKPSRVT